MSVELSIALLFSSKTIPSASSLKYVLYRWVTFKQKSLINDMKHQIDQLSERLEKAFSVKEELGLSAVEEQSPGYAQPGKRHTRKLRI